MSVRLFPLACQFTLLAALSSCAWSQRCTSTEESQKIPPTAMQPGAAFGHSLSVDGAIALFGAVGGGWTCARSGGGLRLQQQRLRMAGKPDSGSAALFRHNGSSWVEEQVLGASDGAVLDLFGPSV